MDLTNYLSDYIGQKDIIRIIEQYYRTRPLFIQKRDQIVIYDLPSKSEIGQLKTDQDSKVCSNNDFLYLYTNNKLISYNLSNKLSSEFSLANVSFINCDDKYLYLSLYNPIQIRIYQVKTLKLVGILEGIGSNCIIRDNSILYTVNLLGGIKLWNVDHFSPINTILNSQYFTNIVIYNNILYANINQGNNLVEYDLVNKKRVIVKPNIGLNRSLYIGLLNNRLISHNSATISSYNLVTDQKRELIFPSNIKKLVIKDGYISVLFNIPKIVILDQDLNYHSQINQVDNRTNIY